MEYILKFDWGDAGEIDSHWLIHVSAGPGPGRTDGAQITKEVNAGSDILI